MQTSKRESKGNAKVDRDKELLFFIGIFVVAAIAIMGVFILPSLSEPDKSLSVMEGDIINVESSQNSIPLDLSSCLANYGISKDTVFFIYSDTCYYSKNMIPWVQQMESEGYKFLWADTTNASAIQIASTCLSGILRYEGTPEFICPSNGNSRVGAFSSLSELEGFANNCK